MLAFTIALDATSLTRNDVTVGKSNDKHSQICPLSKNPNFSIAKILEIGPWINRIN